MLPWAFSYLVQSVPEPAVSVETYEQDARLRGIVVRRFLEGGRVIASPGSADAIRVVVRSLGHSVLVEASLGSRVESAEIDHGDPELAGLEVAHAATDIVQRLVVSTTTSDGIPRVSLRFVGFEPDGVHYADATEALIDSGFRVVGEGVPTDWTLCVWK